MANVESSGVAKAGLTTGIIGTSLAGLMAMNNNGSGGGLLNGLLGGNCNNAVQAIAERDAIIAKLSSEKYTDTAVLALRDKLEKLVDDAAAQTVKNDKAIATNAQEIACLQRQIDTEAKWSRENMALREQIIEGKIASVAQAATTGINNLGSSLASLQATVNSITSIVVPRTAVCPEPMPLYNSWTAPTTTTASA